MAQAASSHCPLVILDRDGVINHDSDQYVASPEQWHAIEGSLAAIARLNQAAFPVAVATNQSGVARGYYTEQTLIQIHHKMHRNLAAIGGWVDAVYYCLHGPEAGCRCRKPQPGMLERAQRDLGLPGQITYFIGDKLSDIKAARASGCRPILLTTGYGKGTLTMLDRDAHDVTVFPNLAAAVHQILLRHQHNEPALC